MFSSRASKAIVCGPPMFSRESGRRWKAARVCHAVAPSPERRPLPASQTLQRPRVPRICRLGVARLRDGISSARWCTCFTESTLGDPDGFCGCSRRSASLTS